MKTKINTGNHSEDTILRERVKELLKKKPAKTASSNAEADGLKLFHELEVQQIKLELINEELKRAKEDADITREKYIELFDFAPSGYFTLTREGKITKLNLSGANMLGKNRSHLKNSLFGFFISNDTKPIFNLFLEKVFTGKAKESCEVSFLTNDNFPMHVHVTGIIAENGEQCLVNVVDITERKRVEKSLQIALERLDLALLSSKAGSWNWNIVTGNIEWSAHMFDLFGVDPQTNTASLEKWRKAIHPHDRKIAENRIDQAIKRHLDLNSDYRVILPSGQIRWINAIGKGIYDDQGNPAQMIGICLDITKRKLTEKLIRDLARFPEENANPVYRISKEGELLYFNPASRKIIPVFFPETASKISEQLIKKIKEIYSSGKRQTEELEIEGKIYSFEMIPVIKGGYINMYGIDITKRKLAEKELKNAVKQLKQLYIYQEEIKENERKAISREIHDELGQLLTALKIDIGWINDNIENNTEVKKRLKGMNDIVNDTITTVQRISSDLRPGLLDDLGLTPTLEWYCQNFEERTGIKCLFKSDDVSLTNEYKNITLYRVLQEALTNVIRHAKAKSVNVNLHQVEDSIVLEVIDDGTGMDQEKIDSYNSLGLIGMTERIKKYNGNLNITSSRNKGTKLSIIIPTN